jgi:nicotinamide riboside kinase
MLVSFSGAQSSGKTTLLNRCKQSNLRNCFFVDEVTRYVKRKSGESINEDGTDMTQLLIINTHIENSYLAKDPAYNDIILDRCILDGVVYTEWLFENGSISDWVYEYSKNIFYKLIDELDIIFYTDPSIPLVDDGERSVNKQFRDQIIYKFEKYIIKYNIPVTVLNGNVEERMNTILKTINNYEKET